MASLNKVILIGRLGKDPEVTTFENGNKKVSATLANDIAEGRRNYSKGDMMYVEGKLRTRQYTDQQGITRYVTEVIADKMMQLAPARPATQSSYGQPYGTTTEPASTGYAPQDTTEEGNDLPF